MENLISMTDFVFKQDCDALIGQRQAFLNIVNYAEFITKPLELWMFIPCDTDGSVLLHPDNKIYPSSMSFTNEIKDYIIKFIEAKEKCLFKGFTYDGIKYIECKNYCINISNLPRLAIKDLIKHNLILTETAKNMFK